MVEKIKMPKIECTPQQRNYTRLCVVCIIAGIILDILGYVIWYSLLWWLSSIAWLGAVIFFVMSCWFKRMFKVDVVKTIKDSM